MEDTDNNKEELGRQAQRQRERERRGVDGLTEVPMMFRIKVKEIQHADRKTQMKMERVHRKEIPGKTSERG